MDKELESDIFEKQNDNNKYSIPECTDNSEGLIDKPCVMGHINATKSLIIFDESDEKVKELAKYDRDIDVDNTEKMSNSEACTVLKNCEGVSFTDGRDLRTETKKSDELDISKRVDSALKTGEKKDNISLIFDKNISNIGSGIIETDMVETGKAEANIDKDEAVGKDIEKNQGKKKDEILGKNTSLSEGFKADEFFEGFCTKELGNSAGCNDLSNLQNEIIKGDNDAENNTPICVDTKSNNKHTIDMESKEVVKSLTENLINFDNKITIGHNVGLCEQQSNSDAKVDNYDLNQKIRNNESESLDESASELKNSGLYDECIVHINKSCIINHQNSFESEGKHKIEFVNKTRTIDRKEELKAQKQILMKQKEDSNRELKNGITNTIFSGSLFKRDVFEELIDYLIENRALKELTFESTEVKSETNDIERSESEKYIYDANIKKSREIFRERKTLFENVLRFSTERMPIIQCLKQDVYGTKKNRSNITRSFIDLNKRFNSIIFIETFSDRNIDDEIYSQSLLPLDHYQTSRVLDCTINLREKLEKVVNCFRNISGFVLEPNYKENITESSLKDIEKIVSCATKHRKFENKINISNNYLHSLINMFNNRLTIYDNHSFLPSNNEFVELELKITRLFDKYISLVPSKEISRVISFGKRVEVVHNKIGSAPGDKNNELSIINRLRSLISILNTVSQSEFHIEMVERKVFMSTELLNNFSISESRKSDLKKISNLVKSKVSSHIGRNINEIERFDESQSEFDIFTKEDSIKMKSIIDELEKDKNSLITLFEDLLHIRTKTIEKCKEIEKYFNCIESIDNWKMIHKNNIDNLEKINNTINEFKTSVISGIDIVNSVS